MKNFKQLFAIIFTLAVVVFGVFVLINEWSVFENLKNLSFADWDNAKLSLIYLLLVLVDILLVALPLIGFFLVLTGKYDPFKAIVNCGLVILGKFLINVIVIILIIAASGWALDWKELFFGKDSLLIIPTIVFASAVFLLLFAKSSNYEGTLARAVLATVGSGLAIFGLIFYFTGNSFENVVGGNTFDARALTIVGLIIGISCFAGIVLYSFLPQTRDFKTGE